MRSLRHRHLQRMCFSEKLKALFAITTLFAFFVIFTHLSRQEDGLQKIAFLRKKSSLTSLDNPMVMPGSKTVAEKIPHDDLYAPILHVDKKSRFLDPETRRFLNRSRFFTFLSKYKKVFVDTLVEFDRIWRQKLNRTYILYGGTLLGAYRHGETIPWDDDLDILVDLKYNKTLDMDLKGSKLAILDGFKYRIVTVRRLFFTHNGTLMNLYGRWPFIDLMFFTREKNGTVIKTVGESFVYQTNYIFPVAQIPYENRVFLGPRCPKTVVQLGVSTVDLHMCCTHHLNHRLQKLRKAVCISCSKLHGLFRFVTWRRINDTHSQQMISNPPEPNKMATVYKSKEEKWQRGPVVFMPKC